MDENNKVASGAAVIVYCPEASVVVPVEEPFTTTLTS